MGIKTRLAPQEHESKSQRCTPGASTVKLNQQNAPQSLSVNPTLTKFGVSNQLEENWGGTEMARTTTAW